MNDPGSCETRNEQRRQKVTKRLNSLNLGENSQALMAAYNVHKSPLEAAPRATPAP